MTPKSFVQYCHKTTRKTHVIGKTKSSKNVIKYLVLYHTTNKWTYCISPTLGVHFMEHFHHYFYRKLIEYPQYWKLVINMHTHIFDL